MLSTELDLAFEGNPLKIIDRNGDPWFVLPDLAKAAGQKNLRVVAAELDPDERAAVKIPYGRSGQLRTVTIVSEPGALSIILRANGARTPGTFAWRFRRWITHEVLPSIRQHGCYPPPGVGTMYLPPEPLRAPDHSTRQQRFVEECVRIAESNGLSTERPALIDMMKHIVSETRMKSMFRGDGNVLKLLAHDNAFEALLGFGFDLQYVLNGHYTLTPTERQVRDRLRALPPEERGKVLQALPRN